MNFAHNESVEDVTFVRAADGLSATSIALKTAGGLTSVAVDPDARDLVLMTLGSQVADMTTGSKTTPAAALPPNPGQAWALWEKIAKGHPEFGRPDKFFGAAAHGRAEWVTFTVTTDDPTFFDCLNEITGTEPSRTGLVTLTDSPWLITIAPFPKPHFAGQNAETMVLWGYGVTPERPATYITGQSANKTMHECTGDEILTETLKHLGFDGHLAKIVDSSICIPCVLPHAGSVWLVRNGTDRPKVIPDGRRISHSLVSSVKCRGTRCSRWNTQFVQRAKRFPACSGSRSRPRLSIRARTTQQRSPRLSGLLSSESAT